jgi:polo-like kinase 1
MQIISALKYLHAHKVIHRDIKLGNLFMSDKMEIKFGDFGLATKLEFDGERKRTICGTPNYIAPEILDGRAGHSFEVDIWSLGVLIYTMAIGKPPFETNDVKLTYRRIKMNAYSFPENILISEELKDLITGILVNDPTQRPGLDDIQSSRFLSRNPIPKLLPASSLAVPPSSSYLKQFEPGCTPKEEIRLARPPRSSSQTRISEDLRNTLKEEGKLTEREIRSTSRASSRAGGAGESGSTGSSSTNRKMASVSAYSFTPSGPGLWVKKWVDYSNKYGLAYMLSNGCGGVYFNDSTKIVASCDGESFQYTCKSPGNREEETENYSFSSFPQDLQKKVTLLQHFRKHLAISSVFGTSEVELVFVKKWMVTEHAIIFRLSNKIVQVCFLDKSELLLCSDSKIVSFVDKKGEISVHPLGSAMETSNKEMAKRLRYTKEILMTMLHPNAGTGEVRPSSRNGDKK